VVAEYPEKDNVSIVRIVVNGGIKKKPHSGRNNLNTAKLFDAEETYFSSFLFLFEFIRFFDVLPLVRKRHHEGKIDDPVFLVQNPSGLQQERFWERRPQHQAGFFPQFLA